jgi:hypothetical protein
MSWKFLRIHNTAVYFSIYDIHTGTGPYIGVFFLSMYEHLFVNLLNRALNLTDLTVQVGRDIHTTQCKHQGDSLLELRHSVFISHVWL